MTVLEKFSLDRDIAIITGGAGLLGRYHASALLDVNCKVIIIDNDENKLKDSIKHFSKNKNIFHYQLDITNEKDIEIFIKTVCKDVGDPSILINNASIDPKVSSETAKNNMRLETFHIDQWNNEVNVGLTGAFLCSKHFGSLMAIRKKGVILNISSDLGLIAPNQSIYKNNNDEKLDFVKPVTYSVIKHGLIGLTKYLSTYWIKEGIRCNALAPGGILNNQNPDFVKNIEKLIPMNRMANIDEYQAAVIFLCSDASSYMNGSILSIDGGRTAW